MNREIILKEDQESEELYNLFVLQLVDDFFQNQVLQKEGKNDKN
ncbi:hypothetical protein [Fusobacterium necrophorum]